MSSIINKEVIKSLNPCADRYENYIRYYSDFNGALENFLFLPEISHHDKLWVSLRLLPMELVEVFALDCAVASQEYAAAAAAYAAYAAAYAAATAAYAAATDAADATDAAADAAYAAAADAAAYAAYAAAADAAAYAGEREFQLESIIYLSNIKELT